MSTDHTTSEAEAEAEAETTARTRFASATHLLANRQIYTDGAFNDVWAAGKQPTRLYHVSRHFLHVAGDQKPIASWLDAVLFRAGLHHDVIYQSADRKGVEKSGLPPQIRRIINNHIQVAEDGCVTLNIPKDTRENDPLLHGVQTLFEVQNDGANKPISSEFLSALYAMEQGRALGIPDKYILAECAHIAGTIPFRPANYFNQLEQRLNTANTLLPQDQCLSASDISRTIKSAVTLANRDVGAFARVDFDDFMTDTVPMLREDARLLGNHPPVDPLAQPSALFNACRDKVSFFNDFLKYKDGYNARRVFHACNSQPSETKLALMEEIAQSNITKRNHYLTAHAAAAALVAAQAIAKGAAAEDVVFTNMPTQPNALPTDSLVGLLQKALHTESDNRSDTEDALATIVDAADFLRPFYQKGTPQANAMAFLERAQSILATRGIAFDQLASSFPETHANAMLPSTLPQAVAAPMPQIIQVGATTLRDGGRATTLQDGGRKRE